MNEPETNAPRRRWSLRSWEWAGLAVFALVVVAFGVLVEIRSAFMSQRRTDFGVYLRAAWAVRAGEDIYSVADEHDWHYCYPPALAVLLTPLAEPPAGVDRTGTVPFAVSVALWYALSILCVFVAAHWFASGLGDAEDGRRWWYARTYPVYLALAPIGCSLSRGQVNLLVILCLAGWFRGAATGRSFRSGLWLAAAVAIKFIPAFLALVPLWRGDRRALAGLAVGIVIGFGLVPAAAWGISGAVEVNRRFAETMILPAVSDAGDHTRDEELLGVVATDNQSFQAIIHNYRHWSDKRPGKADVYTKAGHLVLAGSLTLITLLAAGRRPDADPRRLLLLIGCLSVLMILSSPVSHMHYFCLTLPLVAALFIAPDRDRAGRIFPDGAAMAALVVAGLVFAFGELPIWSRRRDAGLPAYASLLLWAIAIRRLATSAAAGEAAGGREALPAAADPSADDADRGTGEDTGRRRGWRTWFDLFAPRR